MTRLDVRNLPTMAEINKLKKDYTAVSFFAGGGGSSTGHKLAGMDILYSNEFIPAAQDTYRANHPTTILDGSDIRTLDPRAILKQIGLKVGELDLLDGSPPCSPFSSAGVGDKGWNTVKAYSDTTQRTDDLFDEFVRMVKGIKPKTFVAENVAGLVKGSATGYFVHILKELKALGYDVSARVLDAALLGVPQARLRLILVGVRNDLKLPAVHPQPYGYQLAVRDVLPNIRYIKQAGTMTYVPADRPSYTITASDGTTSETARFSCGGFIEDSKEERRKFTLKELRVICSFPSDYKLTGTFEQRWERLGRAVPPMVHYNVAKTLRDKVLDVHYGNKPRKALLWIK